MSFLISTGIELSQVDAIGTAHLLLCPLPKSNKATMVGDVTNVALKVSMKTGRAKWQG